MGQPSMNAHLSQKLSFFEICQFCRDVYQVKVHVLHWQADCQNKCPKMFLTFRRW